MPARHSTVSIILNCLECFWISIIKKVCPYIKSGDIHINNLGPTDNPCHICNNEVDTQHHLQCDTCDTWLHSDCVNFNQQELSAYETFDIPFMCPRCEWDKNDLEDIDFDVFNGSDRYSDLQKSSRPSNLHQIFFCTYKCKWH